MYAQVPTYSYNYVNNASTKSILKKDAGSATARAGKRLQINLLPTAVHAVTPIEDADYWFKPVGRWN